MGSLVGRRRTVVVGELVVVKLVEDGDVSVSSSRGEFPATLRLYKMH